MPGLAFPTRGRSLPTCLFIDVLSKQNQYTPPQAKQPLCFCLLYLHTFICYYIKNCLGLFITWFKKSIFELVLRNARIVGLWVSVAGSILGTSTILNLD